jgi:hypothetical protein
MFHSGARRLAALLAVSVIWVACKGKEAETAPAAPEPVPPVSAVPVFKVTTVELGNAIGADKRVAAPASVFSGGDTIYAVVATEGALRPVVLAATWTFEDGQLVAESTETIESAAPAATEFHISKPDGLPPGRYKVEIKADNATVGSKEFEVR